MVLENKLNVFNSNKDRSSNCSKCFNHQYHYKVSRNLSNVTNLYFRIILLTNYWLLTTTKGRRYKPNRNSISNVKLIEPMHIIAVNCLDFIYSSISSPFALWNTGTYFYDCLLFLYFIFHYLGLLIF